MVSSESSREYKGGKVNTKTNLVHDSDSSILGLLVQLHHGGGNVARGHNILLLSDRRLDDGSMEGVRNQADDQVMLGNLGIQSLGIGNIERNRCRELHASGQALGSLEGSACYLQPVSISYRSGKKIASLPTVTGMPASVKTSSVGPN